MLDVKRLGTLACAALLLSVAPASAQPEKESAALPRQARVVKAAAPASPADKSEELAAAVEQLRQLLADQSRELEAQRTAMREQQEKIAALERRLQEQSASARSTAEATNEKITELERLDGQLEAVADSQKELGERVNKIQADTSAAARANEGKLRQVGNFRFSGDLRMRWEPFIQEGALFRQRSRVRARLNLLGNITDELFGGISLASGTLEDVNSSNQSFTNFFTRKNIGLDRMFIQYKPKFLGDHLIVGAGKFAYPWVRTPLTFDTDVNPEGFHETLTFDVGTPVLKNIALVGFQLPVFETSGSLSSTTGAVTASGNDAAAYGAQLQTRWKLGDRINLGFHVGGINFINSDRIAVALGGVVQPSLPNSNTLRTNATGATVGYAARFLYFDTLAQLEIRPASSRWPLNLLGHFVRNMRDDLVVQSGTASPTGTAPNRERDAWWLEAQFGRLNEVQDVQFGYTFVRIEKDALIGAFNESDLRSSTNVRNHRFNLGYQPMRNVQFISTLWLGRLGNPQDNLSLVPARQRLPGSACGTSPFTGCEDTFLRRVQVDVIYKF